MARSRTSSELELFVPLDRTDGSPLHRQLERQLRDGIRSGRLPPDTSLPSSRSLAGQLGVSRGIVVEAYEQLVAEGYLASRPGGTTRVARAAAPEPARRALPASERFPFDFRPGRPDVDLFPRDVWLRSLRRVLNALEGGAGLELLMDKIKTTRSNDEFLAEIAKAPTAG